MASAPKISVVMPCYNAAGTVARAIESICGQSFEDWELLVIDDGSSDGSAEIVESIAADDPRIRLIRREHEGVVGASNRGLLDARGDLIARMDSDDVSLPLRLEPQPC